MSEEEASERGFRERSEEAIGEVAQALLENPLFNQALTTALGAGERAMQAQRSAMGALNLPSAADLERLERRLRSLSERVEAVEDRLDDVARDVVALRRKGGAPAGQARRGVPGAEAEA